MSEQWSLCKLLRGRLLDLLVTGSFPDQFYRVGMEVIRNKKDFLFFSFTQGNQSIGTQGGREVKSKGIFWPVLKYIL